MRLLYSRGESGAAMVEFAIILPILLLLILGMVEFSRAYNAQVTVTQASREGVRILAITGDSGAAIDAAEAVAGTTLDTSQLTVTPTGCDPEDRVRLTVSYPLTYDITFFGMATINLSATGVMRCGG